MARKRKKKKEEMTNLQFALEYAKQILIALAYIAFGCTLLHYAPDISKWFGDKVQEAADSFFGTPQQ